MPSTLIMWLSSMPLVMQTHIMLGSTSIMIPCSIRDRARGLEGTYCVCLRTQSHLKNLHEAQNVLLKDFMMMRYDWSYFSG